MQSTLIEIYNQRQDVKDTLARAFPGQDPLKVGTDANRWLSDWWNRVHLTEYPNTQLIEPGEALTSPALAAGTRLADVVSKQVVQPTTSPLAPQHLAQAVPSATTINNQVQSIVNRAVPIQAITPKPVIQQSPTMTANFAISQGLASPIAPKNLFVPQPTEPITSPIAPKSLASAVAIQQKPLINLNVAPTSQTTTAFALGQPTLTQRIISNPVVKAVLEGISAPIQAMEKISGAIASGVGAKLGGENITWKEALSPSTEKIMSQPIYQEVLEKGGVPKTLAFAVSALAFPVGGGAKLIGGLSKTIAKETSEAAVNALLKAELPKLSDDVIARFSKAFAKETDAKIIESTLKDALKTPLQEVEKVSQYLTTKYGRTFEQATQSQLREGLIETKAIVSGEAIADRAGSSVRGFEKNAFDSKPGLLGGYETGVLTDAYVLIKDKAITQKYLTDIFEKNARTVQKRLNLTEKQVQEFIAKDIENAKNNVANFPKIEEITPKISDTKPAFVQGVYVFNNTPFAVISDGSKQVAVNVDKLAFMKKNLPNAQIRIVDETRPVVFAENGKVRGLLMVIKTEGALPFKPSEGITKTTKPLTQEATAVAGQAGIKKTAEAVPPVKQGIIVPSTRLEKQVGVLGGESIPPVLQKAITKEIPSPKLPQAGKLPTISETNVGLPGAKVSDLNIPSTQTYKEAVDKSIVRVAQQVKESPTIVRRVIDSLKETKARVLEYVQNSEERVRQLVARKDVKVTDISDPYMKAKLYPGKVDTRITLGKEEANTIIKEMKKVADDFKTDLATVRKEVNDYLQFRHAPERNVALGEKAAGITTKEAQEGLKVLESSPRGSQIKALADKAQALNNKTLETLRESGVITEDLYNTLRKKYKNHVPLQRIFEETDNIEQALSGRGYDVKTTGIIRAKGSERAVEDILSNIVSNYQQAILRAEKNIVDNSTLAFVRENKAALGNLFEIKKPRAIGTAFDGRILLEKTSDPTILQMFEKGKPIWIKINDQRLAIALRGVGREKLGTLLNVVGKFTKLYSGLATRFNPEFALPNKIRDLQEAAVYLASQKGVGFTGAAKTVGRDVLQQNTKAIFDALRGVDSEGARLYNEMKSFGGTTGGFGLSTKTQVKMSIEQLEKLANSKTRRIANNILKYVDYWNTIFEDSTRLSVYRQSLSQGLSKERSAFLAKQATIDFNTMGTGGPVINALWMFSNASIQGSVKMIRSLKNPKVLGATVAVIGGSVAAVNQWNDKVDPEWRDKVSRWDRLNGLSIAIPTPDGGIRYIVIPVSWGIKPIKVMADYAYDAVSGNKFDFNNFINDTITAIADAYNPSGGSDLVSAITPTVLDVPVELARNTSWSGNKIKPDYDPNAPQDIRYFDSLTETKTGEAAISLSEALRKYSNIAVSPADIKYAYEQYTGGLGRTTSKAVNTMVGFATGQPVSLDEYPFISRFYREKSEQEASYGAGGGIEQVKTLLQEQSRERFNLDKEATALYNDWLKLPKEEANAKANELKTTNPQLYEKLKDVAETTKAGLNYTESLIKQLGVENGERAKYIYEQAMKLPTTEEKNAYINDLKAKKIISETVLLQLRALKNK